MQSAESVWPYPGLAIVKLADWRRQLENNASAR